MLYDIAYMIQAISLFPLKYFEPWFEDIAKVFDSRERLKDPVAAQQIVGDIECDAPPPGKLKTKTNL